MLCVLTTKVLFIYWSMYFINPIRKYLLRLANSMEKVFTLKMYFCIFATVFTENFHFKRKHLITHVKMFEKYRVLV